MAEARYLLKPGDLDYGHICECGSPKQPQSRRCADCYTDRRRAGLYPNPPVLRREQNPNWKGGVSLLPPTGRSSARPQPVDHPWRKAEALRLNAGSRDSRGHRQPMKGTGSCVA